MNVTLQTSQEVSPSPEQCLRRGSGTTEGRHRGGPSEDEGPGRVSRVSHRIYGGTDNGPLPNV